MLLISQYHSSKAIQSAAALVAFPVVLRLMPLVTATSYMLRVELALSATIALTAKLVLIFTVGVLNTITAFFFQACLPL